MRKIGILIAGCAGFAAFALAPTAAFASIPPPPNGGSGWAYVVSSSSGGSTMYAELTGNEIDYMVCDTKSDGRSAYGELDVVGEDSPWTEVSSRHVTAGFGHCLQGSNTLLDPQSAFLRIMAVAMSNGKQVDTAHYLEILGPDYP